MSVLRKYQDVPEDINSFSKEIIDCLFCVHKELGPGYLEQVYEEALCHEFEARGFQYQQQKIFQIYYKGRMLKSLFKADLIVENKILLELKSVDRFHPVHDAQIQSYLKTANLSLGFLVNFNVPLIKEGIKRHMNKNFVTS